MKVLNEKEIIHVSGGNCTATIVINLPTSATRAFNNIMMQLATGTMVTPEQLIASIEALRDLQGQTLNGAKVKSITYENLSF